MHHGPEFTVVLIFGLALVIGAATRLISSRTKFPYTIAMLLIGLLTGIGIRQATHDSSGEAEHEGFLSLIGAGADISPDLIIFVFLPALVFESAYAIEVHRFRKNVGAVLVMAVPALLAATALTAAMMVFLTSSTWAWAWLPALVFGALISATDPVAVVAILRELGVTKRLAVVIEGESLLNDATAIVVFGLLLELLTGSEWLGTGAALLSFLKVALGGVAVGLLLSWLLSSWIGRLFNDPLAEITLTLVLAYGCMIIAEGFLHVSGVMAVVAAGLWMSGGGRTKISPEVAHFLHRFWLMLGYIANTLIFFLVGLAMSKAVESATAADLLLILVTYVGIMVIRLVLTFATQPITTRLSEGISAADGAIITWGGLRGAVSLALALIVAQNAAIPEALRQQILLVSTGVVFLTILVNGTTIGKLLARLGYDKPPLPEQIALLSARAQVVDGVHQAVEGLSNARDLRTVHWGDVEARLATRRRDLEVDITQMQERLTGLPDAERVAGCWLQVLGIERQVHWESYTKGTLTAEAMRILPREIDGQLDRLGRGQLDPPASRTPDDPSGFLTRARRWMRNGRRGFEELELLYQLSRAETLAAERVLKSVDKIKGASPLLIEQIRETYQGYLRAGKERIEDFRTNAPEVASAIESRLASRIELNYEREGLEHLEHHGVLDEETAEAEIATVEKRMYELKRSPTRIEMPKTVDLVASTPLFRALDEDALRELAKVTEEQVLPAGAFLCKEGERGDSLMVIARGAVHVTKLIDGNDVFLDVLGGGDVIGEIALLTGAPRTASVRAATAVTLGVVSRVAFDRLMQTQPTLRDELWRALARRSFSDTVLRHEEFSHLDHQDRLSWADSGRTLELSAGDSATLEPGEDYVFVLIGSIRLAGRDHRAPALLPAKPGDRVEALESARVMHLPPAAAALRSD